MRKVSTIVEVQAVPPTPSPSYRGLREPGSTFINPRTSLYATRPWTSLLGGTTIKKTTNPELIMLIRTLKKGSRESGANIWRDIAGRLSRSRKGRVAVNVSRLNRHTKKGETVVVPGKVLGAGSIDHSLNVAAFAFSERAQSKILKARGKCLSILKLMEKNPKGTDVKIIG